MQPNCFIATTASTLAIGGSETELFLSNITTLTGETVTTAQFATMGRGVITVDPLSTTSIEFMSFTGVDQVGVGFTGLTRGLSSLSNSVVSTNIKYHPIGTQVIIAFGVHNLLDLKTYITNVTTGGIGNSSNLVAGTIYSTANNANNRPRALSSLVQQQNPTVNMTLLVQGFSISTANVDIVYAGGSTTTYTAPGSNPRIDLLTYNTVTSALAYRTGAEASTPIKPTPSQYDIVLASIYHKVGEIGIKDTNDGSNGAGSYGYIQSWYYPSIYNNQLQSQYLGDGSDGAATFDGTTTYSAFSTTTGAAPNLVYTLTRNIYLTNLTISSGKTINPANFIIYVNGTASGTGTLQTNGGNGGNGGNGVGSSSGGTGGTGGGAALVGFFTSPAGGAGGLGGSNGSAGAPGTNGTSVSNALGSSGLVGGAAVGIYLGTGAGAGGTAGVATAPVISIARNPSYMSVIGNSMGVSIFGTQGGAGAGGGGGCGNGIGSGGGGGGAGQAGGIIFLVVNIYSANYAITATGGTGGNGGNRAGGGGGGGGGSGGNGGVSVLLYKTKTGINTYTLTGGTAGTGGTGASNGNAGTAGATGTSYEISI